MSRELSPTESSTRRRLATDLVRTKAISFEQAEAVVAMIGVEVSRVQGMFSWMRGDACRNDLTTRAWAIVLKAWPKWDPNAGPPAPYFRTVLGHALRHSVRADDPRRAWTKGKNKPKLLGWKLPIVSSEGGTEKSGGQPVVFEEGLAARYDPMEKILADESMTIRMSSALLAVCGGDVELFNRVLNAERKTDPEGVAIRARIRKELKAVREYGRELGLEDK